MNKEMLETALGITTRIEELKDRLQKLCDLSPDETVVVDVSFRCRGRYVSEEEVTGEAVAEVRIVAVKFLREKLAGLTAAAARIQKAVRGDPTEAENMTRLSP